MKHHDTWIQTWYIKGAWCSEQSNIFQDVVLRQSRCHTIGPVMFFFFPLNMAWQPWMINDKILGGLVKHSQDLKHDDSLAAQQKTLPDRLQDSQDVVACHRLHLFIGQCDEVRQIGDEWSTVYTSDSRYATKYATSSSCILQHNTKQS